MSYSFFGGNVKVGLDLSNHATKSHAKEATGFCTSSFAKKIASLQSDINKLDIVNRKMKLIDKI